VRLPKLWALGQGLAVSRGYPKGQVNRQRKGREMRMWLRRLLENGFTAILKHLKDFRKGIDYKFWARKG
jgi:hypothetical protein